MITVTLGVQVNEHFKIEKNHCAQRRCISLLRASPLRKTTAIMNGEVPHRFPAASSKNGDVIIQNGRITQVGADLAAPAGATVIDATGKVVTPGLFAPFSSIGLVEVSAVADSYGRQPGFRVHAGCVT